MQEYKTITFKNKTYTIVDQGQHAFKKDMYILYISGHGLEHFALSFNK